jgi:signal transduction histidine kinase
MWLRTLRGKITALILLILVISIGGTYSYTIRVQSTQFVDTTKDQARILTHAIVRSIQHDFRGTCTQDIQGIFERIGILPDIESLRIFDEEGMVTKSADPADVGHTIEEIGYEIFQAGIPSTPYRGGQGYNAFCMVEPIRNEENCRLCHTSTTDIMAVFELCLSMKKTDLKVATNRRFLIYSAIVTIALVGLALVLLFTYQVNRPVKKLVAVMGSAEEGDLSVRSGMPRRDELGTLGRSLDSMIEKLDASQKELESYHTEQLIRAERLASIGELAASVAHEIKNPLAGISGAVQVLAEDYEPDDPRREITKQVIKQCERMDKTIRDLLSYAQPLQAELSLVDVNRVLDHSLFIALPNPAKSPVAVRRNLREDLPPVAGDAKHLEQVFLNLVLNALQAMPEGGELSLRTRLVEPDPAAIGEGPVIEVKVADTGGGIPEEVREKIFNPFYTTRTRGTGLGLPITKKILEQHGATISFDTRAGEGTTFTVRIPLEGGVEEWPPREKAAAPAGA